MKTLFVYFLLITSVYSQTLDDYCKFTERWEKTKNKIYYVNDIPHIGVGFNLTEPHIREKIAKVGGLSGDLTLTDEQIDAVYNDLIWWALFDVKKIVPDFDNLPKEYKFVLVDLRYQLGLTRFMKFKKAIAAINKKDYHNFRLELIDSKWYRDWKHTERVKHHIDFLKGVSNAITPL